MTLPGFKSVTILILAGLLGGCAFTNQQVSLHYTPTSYPKISEHDATIQVNDLKDARGVSPKVISYKGVQTRTGGQYINDVEISRLLTDCITDVLGKMGYKTGSSESDLALSGEVLKFDSYVIMGFWSGSVEATIQLNLKLTDKSSGAILWTETFSGNGKKGGAQVDRWGNRKEAFDQAMDSLIREIAFSESLQSAIKRFDDSKPATANLAGNRL